MHGRIDVLQADLAAHATTTATVEPWVGPEGQLRVRLERLEQTVLALLEDPNNPVSSAERARMILTSIPAPAA